MMLAAVPETPREGRKRGIPEGAQAALVTLSPAAAPSAESRPTPQPPQTVGATGRVSGCVIARSAASAKPAGLVLPQAAFRVPVRSLAVDTFPQPEAITLTSTWMQYVDLRQVHACPLCGWAPRRTRRAGAYTAPVVIDVEGRLGGPWAAVWGATGCCRSVALLKGVPAGGANVGPATFRILPSGDLLAEFLHVDCVVHMATGLAWSLNDYEDGHDDRPGAALVADWDASPVGPVIVASPHLLQFLSVADGPHVLVREAGTGAVGEYGEGETGGRCRPGGLRPRPSTPAAPGVVLCVLDALTIQKHILTRGDVTVVVAAADLMQASTSVRAQCTNCNRAYAPARVLSIAAELPSFWCPHCQEVQFLGGLHGASPAWTWSLTVLDDRHWFAAALPVRKMGHPKSPWAWRCATSHSAPEVEVEAKDGRAGAFVVPPST